MQTGQTLDRRRPTGPRGLLARIAQLDDRATSRWIKRLGILLVVGTAAIGALYVSDQFRPEQPSLIERSVAAAEAVVTEQPNLLSARLDLARAYVAADRPQDAIAQYDQILGVQADVIPALLGRGRLQLAAGELDRAAADFGAVVTLIEGQEMAPVSVELEDAYYNLGRIDLRSGDDAAAVTHLQAAVRIRPTDADALYLLGTALIATGAPEDAVPSLAKAAAMVPWGWCEPYSGLATAYAALKDDAGVGYANGMVAGCEGRHDEATTLLTAQAEGPHGLDALIGLGQIAEVRKDPTAAAGYYARALALDSRNFSAINGLNRVGADETGTLRSPAPAEGE